MVHYSLLVQFLTFILANQVAAAFAPRSVAASYRPAPIELQATSNPFHQAVCGIVTTTAVVVAAVPLEAWAENTNGYEYGSDNDISVGIGLTANLLAILADLLDNTNPFWDSPRTFLGGMSLSELAGNASFLCAMGAFLNTDILVLRFLVMGGIALGVVFQYYYYHLAGFQTDIFLFLVNAAMATALIMERRRAGQMSTELYELYRNGSFEKRGFSRVEFMKLFECGTKVELNAGDQIAREGLENTKL